MWGKRKDVLCGLIIVIVARLEDGLGLELLRYKSVFFPRYQSIDTVTRPHALFTARI